MLKKVLIVTLASENCGSELGPDIMLKSVLQLRLVSLTEKNFNMRFSGPNIRVREGLKVLEGRTRAPGRRSQRGSSTD
ncbi:uncharacterized protein FTOL_11930 [Fusarium torulosum]|uniref:Uncharacterized protein n=1 Tax=Fusarium torulosum TaxID=33205 RepID=A0AAE8MKU1_9HYPO|nr:uncharacterized protein FTOL_11930 [Fusarium torulosum]